MAEIWWGHRSRTGFWAEDAAVGVWKCEVSEAARLTGDAEEAVWVFESEIRGGESGRDVSTRDLEGARDGRNCGFLDRQGIRREWRRDPGTECSGAPRKKRGVRIRGNVRGAGRKKRRTGEVLAAWGLRDGETVPGSRVSRSLDLESHPASLDPESLARPQEWACVVRGHTRKFFGRLWLCLLGAINPP